MFGAKEKNNDRTALRRGEKYKEEMIPFSRMNYNILLTLVYA